jgi:osmotically-inducible protein OsmY
MKTVISFALGAATGAAAAHFLDPESGARRRNQLREQGLSKARKGTAAAQSQAQYAAGAVKGAASTVTPSPTRVEDADDVTLARKVESEIFRDADAPKGDVSVDVQAGVVYLRGEIADESWIARLGEEAGKVDGIKGVQNLLHTPGTPAPAAEPRGVAQEQLGSS